MTNPLPAPCGERRYEMRDARADGQRRAIDISRERVVIKRGIGGVPMTIKLATSSFRGVSLRLRQSENEGFAFELALVHRDADLSVTLERADEEEAILDQWGAWAEYFGLPTLVERELGIDEPHRRMIGQVVASDAAPRRRGGWIAARRPRFLARRKPGAAGHATMVEKSREMFPLA